MEVGFSQIKITPPIGVVMAGHPGIKRATGVLDDLYARSMAIRNGMTTVVFTSVDILFIERSTVTSVRRKVLQKTGIPEGNIHIFATHTHSGPLTGSLFGLSEESKYDYVNKLETWIIESIMDAIKNLQEAFIGIGKTVVENISFNSRYIMKNGKVETHPWKGSKDILWPEGPIDREMICIYAIDRNRRLIGALINFANHPQILERENPNISADFPGRMERHIREKVKCNSIILFGNGAGGDVCPVNPLDAENIEVGEKWMDKVGLIMADNVLSTLLNVNFEKKLNIKVMNRTVKIRLREIPADIISEANRFLSEYKNEKNEMIRLSNYGVEGPSSSFLSLKEYLHTKEWKRQEYMDVLALAKIMKVSPEEEIEISIITLNENAIVLLPFEVFSEIGLEIKKRSPYMNTLMIELANGYAGYLPTKKAFSRHGGYETITLRSSRFIPEAEEIVIKETLSMLYEMKTI